MKNKIFVINLDSSTKRWLKIKNQLLKFNLDYERISAVDGRIEAHINKKYDPYKNKMNYHRPMSKGAIGCYLSHIKCWKKIIKEKLDFGIILEDDVKLIKDLNDLPKLLSNENFPKWEYIKIGEVPIKRKTKVLEQIEHFSVVRYLKKPPAGTFGQVVSFNGAKKLIKNSQKFYRPVDIDIQYTWEHKLIILGIKPYFVDSFNRQSDINDIDDRKKLKSRPLVKMINIINEFIHRKFDF